MADEKKVKLAKAAFKALCEMLEEHDWHYAKDETELKIRCGAQGDDLPMEIRVEVDVERQLVVLLSPMPFVIPEERRAALAVAVSEANHRIVDGSFDYDYYSGRILFRMTSSFFDSLIGKDVFEYMLMCSCVTIDAYNDKFLLIAKNSMSNEEILKYLKS